MPIAALMGAGMSPNVQRITILGSSLLHRRVREQIESGSGDCFLVALMGGRVAGMVSSRLLGGTLVLNHLYTDAGFRRRGIARALLEHALRAEAEFVAVDVFLESRVARAWYAALGFSVEYRRVWLESTLPIPDARDRRNSSITGMEEADAAHAHHGFSNFKLSTSRAEYSIGRLADEVFRSMGFRILADGEALAALATLDRRRALLCIGAPEDVPAGTLERGRIVEESERLVVRRAGLAAALGGNAAGT